MTYHLLQIALLSLFALAPYYNGIFGDFVHDDIFAIKENEDIRPHTSLLDIFKNDFWGTPMSSPISHKSYRPLTVLTFRLNYIIHQLNPIGYHIVNIMLHWFVCMLIYVLCYFIVFTRVNSHLAFSVCLLFATHPVHTEAVTGVVGRAELLAAIFFISAVIIYYYSCSTLSTSGHFFAKTHSYLGLILVLVFSIFATISKENGITVLGVCGIIDSFYLSIRGVKFSHLTKFSLLQIIKDGKDFFIRAVILVVSLATILGLRIRLMDGKYPGFTYEDNPASFSDSLQARFLTYNFLYVVNSRLLFFPKHLSYDWQGGSIALVEEYYDLRNLTTCLFWFTLLGLIVSNLKYISMTSYHTLYDSKPLLFGLSLLIFPFLPASNLFMRVGFVIAERILYIPSIGFCILIIYGCHRLSNLIFLSIENRKIFVLIFAFFLASFYAMRTYDRNKIWQSRETLFRSGIIDMPHNAKVHYNLANFLKDTNKRNEAISHYKQATLLDPMHASSHNNLGTLLSNKTEALMHFKLAVKAKPSHFKAYFNMGNMLAETGNVEDALDAFYSSLNIDDKFSDCWQSLARLLVNTSANKDQINFAISKVESTASQTLLHQYNLASLYYSIDDFQKAIKVYTKAIDFVLESDLHSVEYESTLLGIARSYRILGRNEMAENWFEKSRMFFPNSITILSAYAAFLFNTKRIDRSVLLYEELDRKHENLNDEHIANYIQVLLSKGELSKAKFYLSKKIAKKEPSEILVKTLISIATHKNDFAEAYAIIQQYSDIVENSFELRTLKATFLRNLQRYGECLDEFKKLIQIQPNNAKILHDFAATLHLIKNYDQAAIYYEKALKLSPNDLNLQNNYEKFKRASRQSSHP